MVEGSNIQEDEGEIYNFIFLRCIISILSLFFYLLKSMCKQFMCQTLLVGDTTKNILLSRNITGLDETMFSRHLCLSPVNKYD